MVDKANCIRPVSESITDYFVSVTSGIVTLYSGLDRQVIDESADASTIIQHAIDLLPTHGGKVSLAAGEYNLNQTIRIVDKHGVHLEGAARGIWCYQPVGKRPGAVLQSEKSIDLVDIFGKNIRIVGTTISNLYVVGSGRNNGKAGIVMRGNMDLSTLYNVGANNCGIGFHFQDDCSMMADYSIDASQVYFCDPQQNGIGMRIDQAHYLKIVGGEFSDCSEYGIFISGKDENSIVSPKISSITAVRNPKAGIYIGKYADDVTITGGCDAAGSSQGSGIIISGEGTTHAPRNVIVSQVHAYNNSHCGILVEDGKNIIIQGCISSVHEHKWVPAPTAKKINQQYGVKICRGVANVVVNGCITYGNAMGEIVDETETARIS